MPDAGMPTQAALALMSIKTTEIVQLYLTAQT
jgi:hypothetical protein